LLSDDGEIYPIRLKRAKSQDNVYPADRKMTIDMGEYLLQPGGREPKSCVNIYPSREEENQRAVILFTPARRKRTKEL
jgi:hypothetical protein